MVKSRRVFLMSPKAIILSLIVLGGLAYGLYRVVPRETASIFLVTEPTTYGEVSVSGTVYKDSPVGVEGSYFLYTADGRAFQLDAVGIDAMVGLEVTAKGYLSPPFSEGTLPFLTVSSMESN